MLGEMSRYAEIVTWFRASILSGPARLAPEVRRAAFDGRGEVPPEATAYLDKVRRHAYKVTDADVTALRTAGWDDERIYEITVAAAAGQGLRRLDLGLAALAAAQAKAPR